MDQIELISRSAPAAEPPAARALRQKDPKVALVAGAAATLAGYVGALGGTLVAAGARLEHGASLLCVAALGLAGCAVGAGLAAKALGAGGLRPGKCALWTGAAALLLWRLEAPVVLANLALFAAAAASVWSGESPP